MLVKEIIHLFGNSLYNILRRKNVKIGSKSGFRLWSAIKCDSKSQIFCGNVSARKNCHIESKNGGKVKIGNNCNFNYNCILVAHSCIQIGNNVSIGPNVLFYDHDHNYKSKNWRKEFVTDDIIIGNNVWIGGNVIILKGTIIEDNCVIAAGTILKGEKVSHNTLVYGDHKINIKK